MNCYICRIKLGEGHQPTGLVVGRGDESQKQGGFVLCFKCTEALMKTWIIMHHLVEETTHSQPSPFNSDTAKLLA